MFMILNYADHGRINGDPPSVTRLHEGTPRDYGRVNMASRVDVSTLNTRVYPNVSGLSR